jgi:hypothetical protein
MSIVVRAFAAAALVAASISCGSVVRNGSAPVLLVIDSLQAIRGATSVGTPAAFLASDVLTIVTSGGTCTTTNPCPTVFEDDGQVSIHMVIKDIGTNAGSPLTPSSNNVVTITRIHVSYRRSDGRNQEGVDVPYGFDSATTFTIPASGTAQESFPLVRVQAKQEAPLMALRTNGQIISMAADVTFYGADLVGNNISATGSINIDFGNWGDQ